MSFTINEARAAVAKGVGLLDEAVLLWRARIKPECLAMGDISHCVLGQAFGEYNAGVRCLLIPLEYTLDEWADGYDKAIEFGFEVPDYDAGELSDEEQALLADHEEVLYAAWYDLLDQAWREALAPERPAGEQAPSKP